MCQFCTIISCIGTIISAYIAMKIFKMGTLSFLNKMFAFFFVYDAFQGCLQTYAILPLFYERYIYTVDGNFYLKCCILRATGYILAKNCFWFMSLWMLGTPNKGIFITGMTICRWQLCIRWMLFSSILFPRFAYVRYASGLLKEGTQLLHWLTIILITIGFFIWHGKAWVKGTYFENTVKFKMCTRDMDESVSRKGLKQVWLE